MRTVWSFLCARPWLLVVLAFVILISAWSTLIVVSGRVPSGRLNPGEEAALLERKSAR